jgi:hypothetical protein
MLAANGGVWRVKVDGFGSFSGALQHIGRILSFLESLRSLLLQPNMFKSGTELLCSTKFLNQMPPKHIAMHLIGRCGRVTVCLPFKGISTCFSNIFGAMTHLSF